MASHTEKVVVVHNESEKSLFLTFRYINEELNIDRTFNVHRAVSEDCSNFLFRVCENIKKVIDKKCKKRAIGEISVNAHFVSKEDGDICDVHGLSCYDAIISSNDHLLKIDETYYSFDVNPPIVKILELPKKNIMSGFLLYPAKLDLLNCDVNGVKFTWFMSKETLKTLNEAKSKARNMKWEQFDEGFKTRVSLDQISRLIKVCINKFIR